jgi:hypothetical protein
VLTAQLDFLTAPEEVEFAMDSPLEGDGFEPSVPRQKDVCKHRDRRRSRAARAQIGGNWRKCRTPAELARSDEATGSIWYLARRRNGAAGEIFERV